MIGPKLGDCITCAAYKDGACSLNHDPGWPSCKFKVVPEPCPACQGDGYFIIEYGDADEKAYPKECEICKGTGKVASRDIPYCDQCAYFTRDIPAGLPPLYPRGDRPDGYCPIKKIQIGDAHCPEPCKSYRLKIQDPIH